MKNTKPVKITRTYDNFQSIATDMACAMEYDDEELSCMENLKITLVVEGDQEQFEDS